MIITILKEQQTLHNSHGKKTVSKIESVFARQDYFTRLPSFMPHPTRFTESMQFICVTKEHNGR